MVNELSIENVNREKINELFNDLMFFVAEVKKIKNVADELKILTGAAKAKLGEANQYAVFDVGRIETIRKDLLDLEIIVNRLGSKTWPRHGEIEAVVKDLKKLV